MSIRWQLPPPNTHAYRLYLVKDQQWNPLELRDFAAISEALNSTTDFKVLSNFVVFRPPHHAPTSHLSTTSRCNQRSLELYIGF